MDQGLEALQNEWTFVRHCSACFAAELSDTDLDRALPRKGLDTFRKHLEEMVSVENDYVNAIERRVMRFDGPADADVAGKLTKEQLLAAMAATDAKLRSALAVADAEMSIKWFNGQRPLVGHLAAMISHETLHIGQMIAFCYALGMEIPTFVREEWALSGR